jgi:hypothetical protein
VRGLTLWQPWASLVAIGAKKIETRSWPTKYRGPVAIHASKSAREWRYLLTFKEDPEVAAINAALSSAGLSLHMRLPLGSIVAVVDLTNCLETGGESPEWPECAFGDYSDGRYAWFLKNLRCLPEPIPCRGAQGLWTVPEDVAMMVTNMLEIRKAGMVIDAFFQEFGRPREGGGSRG